MKALVRSVLVLSVGMLVACGSGDKPSPDERPPIILISIDTLRSDHLPAYGYSGVETPAIDALRSDGILFERAYSPMPLTLPAHASIMTGLQPPGHGVRINMGYSLAGDPTTLPELLREHGYATGAAVSSFVLRGETGIARGFEFFEDEIQYRPGVGPEGLQREGGATLAAAKTWLDTVAQRPFFFFLHFYEPHMPFNPPEPWASRYASAYDGEIAAVDALIARLVQELRDLGIYDEAAIILTSDHGEGLGEHGEAEHGILLYRESLQVPLIVKLPGGAKAGEVVSSPAQLVDLMPTVLELAGAPNPVGRAGVSLLSLARGEGAERSLYAESYYPRLYFGWNELTSVIEGKYHYIHSPEPELYDLESDPGEQSNLIGTGVEASRFAARLSEIDQNLQEPGQVDVETRRRLESLGYIGGTRSAASGPLPAPAAQIHLLGELETAVQASNRGDDAAALAALERILEENDQMILAWELKGKSLRRLGRLDGALAAYRKTLELAIGAPHVALEGARIAAMLGRFDEARELAAAARGWDPVAAHLLLAQVELNRGNPDGARVEAEAALAADPASAESLVVMAQTDLARGAFDEGLGAVDRAAVAAGGDPVRTLHLVRGNLLVQLDRVEEAEAAFRREMELFPRDPRAYSRLAMLFGLSGRSPEAVQTLRELIDRAPALPGIALAIQTLAALGEQEAAEQIYRETRARLEDPTRLDRLLGRRPGGRPMGS